MCLVGSRHYNTFGSHGSAAHVPLAYFVTLDECCAWLRTHEGDLSFSIRPRTFYSEMCTILCVSADCEIIGVEITDAAHAVNTHPFRGNTAFMLGNEVCTLAHFMLLKHMHRVGSSSIASKRLPCCAGVVE